MRRRSGSDDLFKYLSLMCKINNNDLNYQNPIAKTLFRDQKGIFDGFFLGFFFVESF